MANIIRVAKPGSRWNRDELVAYNINIVERDEQQFFGGPLPAYTGPVGFIQHEKFQFNQGIDGPSAALLQWLDLAMVQGKYEGPVVDHFTMEVLRRLGFESLRTFTRSRIPFLLTMCAEQVYTKLDVFLQNDEYEVLLLIQVDKLHNNPANLEARLMANAIAAFQNNNTRRAKRELPLMESCIIYGITMIGTFPSFYKITVTRDLDEAVQYGMYPVAQTVVERHTPYVPGGISGGMKPLDSRIKILQCFQAFRQFLVESDRSHVITIFETTELENHVY